MIRSAAAAKPCRDFDGGTVCRTIESGSESFPKACEMTCSSKPYAAKPVPNCQHHSLIPPRRRSMLSTTMPTRIGLCRPLPRPAFDERRIPPTELIKQPAKRLLSRFPFVATRYFETWSSGERVAQDFAFVIARRERQRVAVGDVVIAEF